MSKVLLISPMSEKHMADKYFMSPALGVVRLAAFLTERGHEADYFDPNLHMVTGKGIDLETKLQEQPWDFIGVSCLEETLPGDMHNLHAAKRLCPLATLFAGGIEAQFNYQTILDKTPCNIVVLAEGEMVILELIEGRPLHEIPGVVFKSNAKPLSQDQFNEATMAIPWEDLPYEVYWDHYTEKYGDSMTPVNEQEIHTVRVFSRNRCPIGCKFCSSTNQLTWGSGGTVPVLSTTEDNLISVVERIIAGHPRVKTVYLTDDDFCISKASVIRFCKKVVEKDFGDLTFMCFARAADLDEELLGWMKQANFRRLVIGVESFSQPVLDDMNKRCDASEIHDALEACHAVGIKPHINIILVTPGSRLDDIEISIDQTLYYLEKDYVYAGIIAAIRPLKGTEYNETNADYMSRVVDVPGTDFHVKVDDMIWAVDPYVREIQEQYWFGIDAEVGRQVEMAGIVHPTGDNVARFSLMFMKKLIKDVRQKNNLGPSVDTQLEKNFAGQLEDSFQAYLKERESHVDLTEFTRAEARNQSVVYK
jgi:radical SAM superfamily enzyme YgiQ (UPF0313 family)